nr:MAG TPA: hypothetical protein [Caudoviricetes sp.]
MNTKTIQDGFVLVILSMEKLELKAELHFGQDM